MKQRLEIGKRREPLSTRIDKWHKTANQHLILNDNPNEQSLSEVLAEDWGGIAIPIDSEEHLEDDDSDTNTNADDVDDEPGNGYGVTAENIVLFLPSSFAPNRFSPAWDHELSLHLGQANDALHNLRISLGKKSSLFRTDIRSALSQQTKTRAWSRVYVVNDAANKSARIYRNAC